MACRGTVSEFLSRDTAGLLASCDAAQQRRDEGPDRGHNYPHKNSERYPLYRNEDDYEIVMQ
jgi:hypothetical protein